MTQSSIKITLYSRPGCHLCEEMKAIIARVAQEIAIDLEEIDISQDAALERAYREQIPVLMAGGRKLARYRISEQELRARLYRVQGE